MLPAVPAVWRQRANKIGGDYLCGCSRSSEATRRHSSKRYIVREPPGVAPAGSTLPVSRLRPPNSRLKTRLSRSPRTDLTVSASSGPVHSSRRPKLHSAIPSTTTHHPNTHKRYAVDGPELTKNGLPAASREIALPAANTATGSRL